MSVEIHQVWREYRATPSPELRNRLVMQYAPLVKYVAGRVRTGLPQSVDPNDLVSEGVFGLIDAIDKFDTWAADWSSRPTLDARGSRAR